MVARAAERKAQALRVGQRLGKYRLKRRVARGGFGDVYEAYDTIEGVSVALKIPLGGAIEPSHIDDFRREVRITAKLDHPNIMPIKNADFIEGIFAIVQPLGQQSLDERIHKRMSLATKLAFIEQLLAGLAHAHETNKEPAQPLVSAETPTGSIRRRITLPGIMLGTLKLNLHFTRSSEAAQ